MDFLRLENTIFSREYQLNIRRKLFTVSKPQVMGIVNCTPDSFYKSSQAADFELQKQIIDRHISEGALWIDLGAQSTRPGAEMLSPETEIERLRQPIEYLLDKYTTIRISVDTFHAKVADVVLKMGVHVINDISGGLIDPEIMHVVASYNAPYVLMHMRGTPESMQHLTHYNDFLKEVVNETGLQLEKARKAGLNDVIIDPGFGFAKTTEQNFELLKNLEIFQLFNTPILVGVSRKSMIYKTLETTPEDALNGTSVLNTIALQKGAAFLRVHDVKKAMEVCKLVEKLYV